MRLIASDQVDFGKILIGASDFAKDTRKAAQKFTDGQSAVLRLMKKWQ